MSSNVSSESDMFFVDRQHLPTGEFILTLSSREVMGFGSSVLCNTYSMYTVSNCGLKTVPVNKYMEEVEMY